MKKPIVLAAVLAVLPAPPGAAQPTQTAEGAQKFLSILVGGDRVRAFVVGQLKVEHVCTQVPNLGSCASVQGPKLRLYDFRAKTIEKGETACTRLERGGEVFTQRILEEMNGHDLDALITGLTAFIRAAEHAQRAQPDLAAVAMPGTGLG